jgi:S-DNA-T family DNA segregation ATPase FtsK/SpoIIIE
MAVVQKRRPSTRAKNQKAAPIESGRAKGPVRPRAWVRDTCSVLFFAAGVFLLLGLGSHVYQLGAGVTPTAEGNSMGVAGHAVGRILFGGLGAVAIIPIVALVWLAFFRLGGDSERQRLYPPVVAVFAFCLLIVSLATVLAIVGAPLFDRPSLGGSVGSSALSLCLRGLGAGGVAVLMGVLALISTAIVLQRSIGEVALALQVVAQAVLIACVVKVPLLLSRLLFMGLGFVWSCLQNGGYLLSKLFVMREPVNTEERNLERNKPRGRRVTVDSEPTDNPRGFELGAPEVASAVEPLEKSEPIIVKPKPRDASAPKSLRPPSDAKSKNEGEVLSTGAVPQFEEYQAPELSLLTREDNQQLGEDDDELRLKAEQIEAKLRDFNIAGRVTQVHPGPVITLFEFEPAAGVKVGRIAALQDDLAMSLRASSIRIIAPLPKRGTVGIEVPNKHRATVRLRECLESQAFDTAESILSVPLGKDTYGDAVVVDIASMPHLLMAGATGTGKSVCINALLLSLLYRAHPSELGLILIDPKVLELSIYDGIPHLRVPVVTDPRQAKGVLSWAVKEMDRRYRYMQKFGVRNIDGYNRVVAGKPPIDADEPPMSAGAVQMQMFGEKPTETTEVDPEADKNVVESIAPEQLKPLPKLVIVIDELADLMLSVGREIEELITRLAQKARAAGIHLIVATQRPSVDVITGLIKANFPARLSFRVSSRIDSRTILDSMGAEKLLGKGDMLFMLPGAVPLKRVHGAFVSDPEVQKVVAALKANCSPQYDEAIIAACDKAMSEGSGEEGGSNSGDGLGEDDFDPFYDRAVELVVEKGQASTSMIQRTFRIGYNRAARIIEMMEREGVVGKMDGVRPREVIAPSVRSTGS